MPATLDERLLYVLRNCQPKKAVPRPPHAADPFAFEAFLDPLQGAAGGHPDKASKKEGAGHLYLGSLVPNGDQFVCPPAAPLRNDSWEGESAQATVDAYLRQCTSHANEEYIVRCSHLADNEGI